MQPDVTPVKSLTKTPSVTDPDIRDLVKKYPPNPIQDRSQHEWRQDQLKEIYSKAQSHIRDHSAHLDL